MRAFFQPLFAASGPWPASRFGSGLLSPEPAANRLSVIYNVQNTARCPLKFRNSSPDCWPRLGVWSNDPGRRLMSIDVVLNRPSALVAWRSGGASQSAKISSVRELQDKAAPWHRPLQIMPSTEAKVHDQGKLARAREACELSSLWWKKTALSSWLFWCDDDPLPTLSLLVLCCSGTLPSWPVSSRSQSSSTAIRLEMLLFCASHPGPDVCAFIRSPACLHSSTS